MADTPAKIRDLEDDLPQWESILADLRKLEPDAARVKVLRETEVPRLEDELKRIMARHANVTSKAEEVSSTPPMSLLRRLIAMSAGL